MKTRASLTIMNRHCPGQQGLPPSLEVRSGISSCATVGMRLSFKIAKTYQNNYQDAGFPPSAPAPGVALVGKGAEVVATHLTKIKGYHHHPLHNNNLHPHPHLPKVMLFTEGATGVGTSAPLHDLNAALDRTKIDGWADNPTQGQKIDALGGDTTTIPPPHPRPDDQERIGEMATEGVQQSAT